MLERFAGPIKSFSGGVVLNTTGVAPLLNGT